MAGTISKLILCGTLWFVWKVYLRFFATSPLDNVPGPESKSWWKGIFPDVFNVNAWAYHWDMAAKYGSVIKIKALFGENQLYVFDLKALHHVIVKEQHIYDESSSFIEANKLMFGPGLLGTRGDQHRKQRKMLNPVFSIAHMREMIPTFYEVVEKLEAAFLARVDQGPQEIDVLSWMTRTALELISQSGLGYSFDPLTEDAVPHPFTTSVKSLGPVSFRLFFPRTYLLANFVKYTTLGMRRWLADHAPKSWATFHELRGIVDILHNTSVEILTTKRKALAEGDEALKKQIGRGKDILSILLKANMEASAEDNLTEDELLGLISTFTFAAMDTTSSALARILWLLSNHQSVQDKLREEIREAKKKHGGNLNYDDLVELPYMDAICRETLRLYPPASMLIRTTRQDVVLPLGKPVIGLDGKEMHEIPIPNNTNVIIGIMAANRNPELWGPDANEWKPERWLSPLPETITGAQMPGIYSHLLTFIGGSRACIGFKFAQLEMKVVLLLLIDTFKFSPSKTKEIVWMMTGVVAPTTADSPNKRPGMPLVVERAK